MKDFNNYKDRNLHEKFDMAKKPVKQTWYIKLLAWTISFFLTITKKQKLTKVNMKGLKKPFLLLCNHNSFLDFSITTKALFPNGGNNVVAIDGFIHREGLLRKAGCICKRKFTNDMQLVRHLLYVKNELKEPIVLYPEARYSLVGINEQIPESLGKLVQLLQIPVVVLITKGHHLDSPVWNLKKRKNRIEARMEQIITKEELKSLNNNEINERIKKHFVYDDYAWQKEHKVKIKYLKRAEGLHKVLYKCPNCKTEFQMDSNGNMLFCKTCHKEYLLDEYNQISASIGNTEFTAIPSWYKWQREEVRKEILEGKYLIEDLVDVDSLPNSKGFINLGEGKFRHDEKGFVLEFSQEGEKIVLEKDVPTMYSVHIEYEYNNKGDCVDLSTLEDTYYIYFKNLKNVVTKIHFATEELYKLYKEKTN
jgi:1-acyl-sn-glycerol-3-phosphate acyltransferase/DNA-directed RNA polymerase subunit RPC12/RpoP